MGTTIGIVVGSIALLVIICMGYVKAPPDQAYIISGLRKHSRVVIGRASVKVPFLERLDKLNLRLMPVDIKTSNAVPTADYININVDAAVNVKISNMPEKLQLAAAVSQIYPMVISVNLTRNRLWQGKCWKAICVRL